MCDKYSHKKYSVAPTYDIKKFKTGILLILLGRIVLKIKYHKNLNSFVAKLFVKKSGKKPIEKIFVLIKMFLNENESKKGYNNFARGPQKVS